MKPIQVFFASGGAPPGCLRPGVGFLGSLDFSRLVAWLTRANQSAKSISWLALQQTHSPMNYGKTFKNRGGIFIVPFRGRCSLHFLFVMLKVEAIQEIESSLKIVSNKSAVGSIHSRVDTHLCTSCIHLLSGARSNTISI